MPLIRELKPGDTLTIGGITIVAEPKNGRAARLRIDTSLPVHHTRAGQAPAQEPAGPATEAPEVAKPQPRPTLFRSMA